MSFTIDASDIDVFAGALKSSSQRVKSELQQANQLIVTHGVSIAQGLAPRDDGVLANSIQPIGTVSAAGGEFGTSLIYAWMREEGGTIKPKKGQFLRFIGRNGQPIFVREVTQKGTHYMRDTRRALEPFAMVTWGKAIERVWDGV